MVRDITDYDPKDDPTLYGYAAHMRRLYLDTKQELDEHMARCTNP